MARTHTFKGSAGAGYGYAAFIEDGQLVITEDWGREGGVIYRGPYQHAQIIMSRLRANAPKLANSIDKYYLVESQKIEAAAEETTITYRFKDSRDFRQGCGHFGYIENGELVLCMDLPREGGVYFRGSYNEAVATNYLARIKKEDKVLYDDILKYFHSGLDEADLKALGIEVPASMEELKQKYSFDEKTKTILFKVKLFMDSREVHNVLVRGRFQADVIKKLMPPIPEVLTLQTPDAREFAVRSDKISAVEFEDD